MDSPAFAIGTEMIRIALHGLSMVPVRTIEAIASPTCESHMIPMAKLLSMPSTVQALRFGCSALENFTIH